MIRRRPRARRDDEGSILPLTIGYALIALALILVCADATSLYLAQKRLDSLADAAALAGSDGFTLVADGDHPIARLSSQGVREQASALVAQLAPSAELVAASSPDGVSARVEVSDRWHPPVITVFVPDGITLHAVATSRTALE